MEITFKTLGKAKETTVIVDGKEVKNLHHADFSVDNPQSNYGYLSVSWSTREKKPDEKITKTTTFQYSPMDSQDVMNITIADIDTKSFNEKDRAQYMLTGAIPLSIKESIDCKFINFVTLPTGKTIFDNASTITNKEHTHLAEVDSSGNGKTTREYDHYHIIKNWKVEYIDHTHTLPINI